MEPQHRKIWPAATLLILAAAAAVFLPVPPVSAGQDADIASFELHTDEPERLDL